MHLKVLSVDQIRKADEYTIEHMPIDSFELMKKASKVLFDEFAGSISLVDRIAIVAGRGNNGGDALVVANSLSKAGYTLEIYLLDNGDQSQDNVKAQALIGKASSIHKIKTTEDLPDFVSCDYIIDGIFGSGLNKEISGLELALVKKMNESLVPIIAIDIPSGLFADQLNKPDSVVVRATKTYTFQSPKKAFFFPENQDLVGEWKVLDIGLHPEFLEKVEVKDFYLTASGVKRLVKSRPKFAHKGSFGRALLVAGSEGKMGAAILSASAAMRAGLGLLTVHVPNAGNSIIQTAVPEAMTSVDIEPGLISHPPKSSEFDAVGIGPGIGTDRITSKAVLKSITSTLKPMVVDADALNLIAEQSEWLSFLPPSSIITPHLKEFERLFGASAHHEDRLELQRKACAEHQIYIILKGAHSSISSPDGSIWFNSTGNPGMATAGSGDVLTGILTALLAQGYPSEEACLLGVYLHGLSGDIAAKEMSQHSLIASDLVRFLPKAWNYLEN